jgi:hypothetical protein
MFIRKLQRELAVVAIAACAPLVFGCASTNRYVVDPDATSSLVIDAVEISGKTTRFNASGASLDPASMTVGGTTADGEPVQAPLVTVQRFRFRDRADTRETIEANPAALLDGALWRPDGSVQRVTLRSGEVVDVSRIPTTVESEKRVVRSVPYWGAASEISFDDIAYVQTRDSHPGRTVLCLLGVACLGLGIAAAMGAVSWDMDISGGLEDAGHRGGLINGR